MSDADSWFIELNQKIAKKCSEKENLSNIRKRTTRTNNFACHFQDGEIKLFPEKTVKPFLDKMKSINSVRRLDFEKTFSRIDFFIALAFTIEQISFECQQFISKTVFDIFCEIIKSRQDYQIMGIDSKKRYVNETNYSTLSRDNGNLELLKFNSIELPRDIKRMIYMSDHYDFTNEKSLISIPKQSLICYAPIFVSTTDIFPTITSFRSDTLDLFNIKIQSDLDLLCKKHDKYVHEEYKKREVFSGQLSIVELYVQSIVQMAVEPLNGFCCPINLFIIEEIEENAHRFGINTFLIKTILDIVFDEAYTWVGYIRNYHTSFRDHWADLIMSKYSNQKILFDVMCDFEVVHRFLKPDQECNLLG